MVFVLLTDRTTYEDMRESSINLRWSGLYPDIDYEVHRPPPPLKNSKKNEGSCSENKAAGEMKPSTNLCT